MADRLPPYAPDVTNVDAIAKTIRTRESGGNYTAVNPGSGRAAGAYQFLTSTWQSKTRQYGIGTQFATADAAPPTIQDQIARRWISDILAANKGDILSVPYTWYVGQASGKWTDSSGTVHTPDQIPAGNKISVNDYVKGWFDDFKKISGQGPDSISIGDIVTHGPDVLAAGAKDVIAATQDHLISPLTAIPDFLIWIHDAVLNRDNWVRIGLVVGATGIAIFGMSTISKSFGGPGASSVVKSTAGVAAKGAMV